VHVGRMRVGERAERSSRGRPQQWRGAGGDLARRRPEHASRKRWTTVLGGMVHEEQLERVALEVAKYP